MFEVVLQSRGSQLDKNSQLTIGEKFEFAGSIFWLLMDYCWFKEWQTTAYIFILPTISAHFLAMAFGEKGLAYFTIYAALNSWVMANSLWVIGDLNGVGYFVTAADACFKLAIVLTGLILVISLKEKSLTLVLRLFRRFRVKP